MTGSSQSVISSFFLPKELDDSIEFYCGSKFTLSDISSSKNPSVRDNTSPSRLEISVNTFFPIGRNLVRLLKAIEVVCTKYISSLAPSQFGFEFEFGCGLAGAVEGAGGSSFCAGAGGDAMVAAAIATGCCGGCIA